MGVRWETKDLHRPENIYVFLAGSSSLLIELDKHSKSRGQQNKFPRKPSWNCVSRSSSQSASTSPKSHKLSRNDDGNSVSPAGTNRTPARSDMMNANE